MELPQPYFTPHLRSVAESCSICQVNFSCDCLLLPSGPLPLSLALVQVTVISCSDHIHSLFSCFCSSLILLILHSDTKIIHLKWNPTHHFLTWNLEWLPITFKILLSVFLAMVTSPRIRRSLPACLFVSSLSLASFHTGPRDYFQG